MIETTIYFYDVNERLPKIDGCYLVCENDDVSQMMRAHFTKDLQNTDSEEAFANPDCHKSCFYLINDEYGDAILDVKYWADLPSAR